MSKKMLIDAAHAEETRVAVIDGNRIEEFDFESQSHKQLRGNIYLAKVTRVEPSLQAAFIEYGGNRHGFLAFNEIHPDYYQIPVADREALMAEEAADEEDDEVEVPRDRDSDEDGEDTAETLSGDGDDDDVVEQELARRRRRLMRRYKIQEVIRRRQIMLVQVVKEERGNKGAALTTYLSLAGRYCVLMPNTARGGGISRKITSATDRKRLKSVVQGLDVPEGMGLIVRTAGAKRTKAEIKRDYDYLLRLWENIRETTLHSVAPSLIYEEEDLVKRTIRDLYDKDIDEVLVEGEAGRDLRIQGAKAGSGGLHSSPVRGRQGQLQGSADQAAKVKAARSGVGRVALAEGDDGRLGHQVPPVRGLRRRGGVQVRSRSRCRGRRVRGGLGRGWGWLGRDERRG